MRKKLAKTDIHEPRLLDDWITETVDRYGLESDEFESSVEIGKWQSHVPIGIISMWSTLSVRERALVAIQASIFTRVDPYTKRYMLRPGIYAVTLFDTVYALSMQHIQALIEALLRMIARHDRLSEGLADIAIYEAQLGAVVREMREQEQMKG